MLALLTVRLCFQRIEHLGLGWPVADTMIY